MENSITPEQLQEMANHKMKTATERFAYLKLWIDAVKPSWSLICVRYAISMSNAQVRTGIKLDSNTKRDLWIDSNGKFYETDKNETLPVLSGAYDIDNDRAVTDYDVIACKDSLINAVIRLPDKCPEQDPVMLKVFRDLVAVKVPQ